MNSGINEFLDHVDQWKLQLHDKLKRMTHNVRANQFTSFTE